MSDPMGCRMPGCGGHLDTNRGISLQTSCFLSSVCYPCDTCGRVHSADGWLMFNRQGAAVYLREGKIEMVLEPKEFTPDATYVTDGWLYVCLAEEDEDGLPPMVELAPGTWLTFEAMDGKVFCFHDEAGVGYRLSRGDVNSVVLVS